MGDMPTTPDRPEEGTDRAAGRRPLIILAGVVLLVVGVLLGSSITAAIKNNAIADAKSKAAQNAAEAEASQKANSQEVQRQTYERELNGLALVNKTSTVYTVELKPNGTKEQPLPGTTWWATSTTKNKGTGDTVCYRPIYGPDGNHKFPYFKDVPLEGSPDGAYCLTKVSRPGGG